MIPVDRGQQSGEGGQAAPVDGFMGSCVLLDVKSGALGGYSATIWMSLVARLHHAGRQHDAAIVAGEVLVRPVDARLVARRLGDPGLQMCGILASIG